MIDPGARVAIPVTHIPGFRSTIANQRGVEKKLLFKTWGGLGDQICAEPTLRYATRHLARAGYEISLASEQPDLFKHLQFKRVFNLNEVRPNFENYYCMETITSPDDTNLVWQFFCHMLTNCVDFPSLCALRMTLPIADKNVVLAPVPELMEKALASHRESDVYIHAGAHWPSKTFPVDWWNDVIEKLIRGGYTPVLIGKETDDNRTTVPVHVGPMVKDLRNKLSLMESVAHLKMARCLITNDSSPLHMAADSFAHIFYVASCKHPDHITHWRKNIYGDNEWAWRMKNLGRDGAWNYYNISSSQQEQVTIEELPPGCTWDMILPSPEDVFAQVKGVMG